MTQKIQEKTKLPVIDVTQPDWLQKVEDQTFPLDPAQCHFQSVGQASIICQKKIPGTNVTAVTKKEDLHTGEEVIKTETETIAAARSDNVVVSNQYHPAIEDSKIWLNTHHLGLIQKLLGEGYSIELLDEHNNFIRNLE